MGKKKLNKRKASHTSKLVTEIRRKKNLAYSMRCTDLSSKEIYSKV